MTRSVRRSVVSPLWPPLPWGGLRGRGSLVLLPAAVSALRLVAQLSPGRRWKQRQVIFPLWPPLPWRGLRGRGSLVVQPAAVWVRRSAAPLPHRRRGRPRRRRALLPRCDPPPLPLLGGRARRGQRGAIRPWRLPCAPTPSLISGGGEGRRRRYGQVISPPWFPLFLRRLRGRGSLVLLPAAVLVRRSAGLLAPERRWRLWQAVIPPVPCPQSLRVRCGGVSLSVLLAPGSAQRSTGLLAPGRRRRCWQAVIPPLPCPQFLRVR